MHPTPSPAPQKPKVREGTWAKAGTAAGVVGAVAAIVALLYSSSPSGDTGPASRPAVSVTATPSRPPVVATYTEPSTSAPSEPEYAKSSYTLKTTGGWAVDLDGRKVVSFNDDVLPALGTDIKLSNYGYLLSARDTANLFQIVEPDLNHCLDAIKDRSTSREKFTKRELPKGSSFCLTTDSDALAIVTVTRDAIGTGEFGNVWGDGVDFQVDLYKQSS